MNYNDDDDYNPFEEANLAKVLNTNYSSDQVSAKESTDKTTGEMKNLETSVPMGSSKVVVDKQELDERERSYQEKLKEYEDRNRELQNTLNQRQQQDRMSFSQVQQPVKNYPKFPPWVPFLKPLFYISIESEIPVTNQILCLNSQRLSYGILLLCVYNILVMTIALILGMSGSIWHFVWALFSLPLMVPVTIYMFFIKFYDALKTNSSWSYFLFLVGSGIQIIFLTTFAVGLSTGLAGWGFVVHNINGSVSGSSVIAGGLGIASAALASILLLATMYILRMGFLLWRSSGGTVENAREEINRTMPIAVVGSAVSTMR